MVSCWTNSLLLGGLLIESTLEGLLAGMVSAKGRHVSVSFVEFAVLGSEPSVSHVDVRISACAVNMVMEPLAWASPTHLEVGPWASEDTSLCRLSWSIRCCIATIVETDISVSTGAIGIVNASFSSCCQDAH